MDRPTRPRVLVMDDTREIVDLLRELLGEEGYRVSAAFFVLGTARTKALAPDVVVTDLLFEARSKGCGFLTLARLEPDLARVPVVLRTAALDRVERRADRLAALRAEVVGKPFDLDTPLRAVGRALAGVEPATGGAGADGRRPGSGAPASAGGPLG